MSSDPAYPDAALSLDQPVRLMRQMSHDMRVPLSAIVATCGLFMEGGYGELTPKQQRALERISRNGTRLVAILDDLMTCVKAQAGEYPLAPRVFEPHTLLSRVIEKVAPAADDKGLALELISIQPVPSRLVGDDIAISRIMLALLWNAVSFTSQGKVCIISSWMPDNQWVLLIQDTGNGIADAEVSHIFELFWRGNDRPQVPTSGCGLGLPMAQALVHALHGELTLIETGPQGSLFGLKLPLAVVNDLDCQQDVGPNSIRPDD